MTHKIASAVVLAGCILLFSNANGQLSWAQQQTPSAEKLTLTKRTRDTFKGKIENQRAFHPKMPMLPVVGNQALKQTRTRFDFHPVQDTRQNWIFNLVTLQPLFTDLTVNYADNEIHKTRGTASYTNLTVSAVGGNPQMGYKLSSDIELNIFPGFNQILAPGEVNNVSISAGFLDPLSFSDSDDQANFEFTPAAEGLDYSLTLGAGTAFPDVFSPDGVRAGAVAEETRMMLVGRVAPDVYVEPTDFWEAIVPEAIDLWQLVLTSDVNRVVTADLTFGESSPYFALDFKNHLGVVFDPEFDLAAIETIEQFIAGKFADGVLTMDLLDVLTVGVVPNLASEFTIGRFSESVLTAVEVPEPATWALLLGCALWLGLRASRPRPS